MRRHGQAVRISHDAFAFSKDEHYNGHGVCGKMVTRRRNYRDQSKVLRRAARRMLRTRRANGKDANKWSMSYNRERTTPRAKCVPEWRFLSVFWNESTICKTSFFGDLEKSHNDPFRNVLL